MGISDAAKWSEQNVQEKKNKDIPWIFSKPNIKTIPIGKLQAIRANEVRRRGDIF